VTASSARPRTGAKKGSKAAAAGRPVRAAHATRRENEALRELVTRLGAQLSDANDTAELLQTAAASLQVTADVAVCDIFLVEGERLRCIASHGPDGLDEAYVGTTIDLETWACTAQSIATREPLIICDLDDERLSEAARVELADGGYASQFCNPLIIEDQVVGVVHLCDAKPRDFADCYDFIRDVSHLVCSTLANELLLEQVKGANRGLRLLAAAGFEISATLDLEQVLNTIARSMCTAADAVSCDIYALDGDVVRGLASADGDVIDAAFRGTIIEMSAGFTTARAIAGQQPLLVFDIETQPDVPPDELLEWREVGMRSGLYLPLQTEGRVHGVVALYDDHPREFPQRDLLNGLAGIAAQAMGNAKTFRSLELRSRENELLAEIARHTIETLSVRQMSATTIEQLRDIVEFDGAAVLLGGVDETPEVVYAWHAEYEADLIGVGTEIGPLWRTLETRPVLRLALPEDIPAGVVPDSIVGLRSVIAVALLFRQHLIGCLALVSNDEDAFARVEEGLLRRLADHLTLAINNARLYEDIQRMHVSNLKALSSALNAKDYYTLGHAARVSAYMLLLAEELGWPPDVSGQIEEAAYLHDIGKIGISDRVLLKPSGLNPHEWDLMRHHPIFSADIIRPLFNEELVLGVRHHHERWDGRGYPDALAGKHIPVMARAMSVVDAYDAMSFRRPYRSARTYAECLAEFKRCRGSQFDPEMVDAFIRVLQKLEVRRDKALQIAEAAALRLDLDKLARLNGPADEARPEYEEVAAALREVRDANPPARYIETILHRDGRFVMGVDADDDPVTHVELGEEIYADQELPEAFAGMYVDCLALVVDQFGAWVTGRVPVLGPDGNVVTVVAVELPPTDALDLEGLHSDVIESFAGLVRRTANQGARAELEAITDGLTGLYNHRYLHERLEEEVERAIESDEPLSLLLCDVDGFKRFNERHGYDEGDRALRAIALMVEESLRGVDLAARFGGDEFAAVLVGTDAAGAAEVADRIRNAIGSAHFTTERDTLTVSIGFASVPAEATGREQLVDKAEWARRSAKRRGRDVVVGFSEHRHPEGGGAAS
jgi:diguanylate cyclase (GGDEF)-like protein